MSYFLEIEESFCIICSEFWVIIIGKFLRYIKRGEEGMEVANEVGSVGAGCVCKSERRLFIIR